MHALPHTRPRACRAAGLRLVRPLPPPPPSLLLLLLTVLLLMVARMSVSACRRAASKPQKRSTLSTCMSEGAPEGGGGGGHTTNASHKSQRLLRRGKSLKPTAKPGAGTHMAWCWFALPCPALLDVARAQAIAHLACPVAGRHGGAQVGELVHLLALGDVGRHDLVVRAHVLQQVGLVQHVLAGLGLVKGKDLCLRVRTAPNRYTHKQPGGRGAVGLVRGGGAGGRRQGRAWKMGVGGQAAVAARVGWLVVTYVTGRGGARRRPGGTCHMRLPRP